jgi:hypothetical protein
MDVVFHGILACWIIIIEGYQLNATEKVRTMVLELA